MQKAVSSKTQRQWKTKETISIAQRDNKCCWCKETLNKSIAQMFFIAWEHGVYKKQTWGLSDLDPKLIAHQIWGFLQLESK